MRVLVVTLFVMSVVLLARADLTHLINHMIHQDYFHKLSTEDQVILVELAAEGEAGRLAQYIHKVGATKIRAIANQLPPNEEHKLIEYVHQHMPHHGHHHNMTVHPPTTTSSPV